MTNDPMVLHPPHYSADRFGVEIIEFTRLMPFCAGNAFKYLARHESKGNPLQDLEKARVYWGWAWESNQAVALPGLRPALETLYWRYLSPKAETDAVARVLGNIIFEEWQTVGGELDDLIEAARR